MSCGRARGDRPAGLRLRRRRHARCSRRPRDRQARDRRGRHAGNELVRRRRQPLSGPPAAVKDEHADALKALKAQAKEIGETLEGPAPAAGAALSRRPRVAARTSGSARYLDEPLVASLARRLIWSFELGGRWVAGLPEARRHPRCSRHAARPRRGQRARQALAPDAVGRRSRARLAPAPRAARRHAAVQAGAPRDLCADRRRARHAAPTRTASPATSSSSTTSAPCARRAAGAARLRRLGPRQRPAAQAPCPSASCRSSSGSSRSRRRWTEENFQFRYLSTDQVRFVTADGEPIALEQVDPVLFSELMRDVDLFVGVAGIGADPTWGDRGDDRFGEYWTQAAFGALSETGKTRHAVLEDLLPGLAIAVTLPARGALSRRRRQAQDLPHPSRLRNIQMEPNNQYLCIVQDRAGRAANRCGCRSRATTRCRSSSRRRSCWPTTTRSRTPRSARRSAAARRVLSRTNLLAMDGAPRYKDEWVGLALGRPSGFPMTQTGKHRRSKWKPRER